TATAQPLDLVPERERSARSWWLVSLRESLSYGRTKAGLVISGLIILVAIFGPLFAPHSPTALVGPPFPPPPSGSILGTDYVAEDVFSRVLWGGWFILWMAFLAGLIGTAGGTALGVIAGYSRKWADEAIMRSLDVLLALPAVVFVLLFVSMLG